MKTEDVKPDMRVEGGEYDDHDTGTVDSVTGDLAIVRWDSGVVTPCPVSLLAPLPN